MVLDIDNHYHKHLISVKDSDQLIAKVKELKGELDDYEERLQSTLETSHNVRSNMESLISSLHDLDLFLVDLAKKRTLFFIMSSLGRKVQNFHHIIRSKTTQLLTSVTLELLTRPPPDNTQPILTEKTVEPDDMEAEVERMKSTAVSSALHLGRSYLWGIQRPQNYVMAVQHLQVAVDGGDSEAMLLLADCYSLGRGVPRDEQISVRLVERAQAMGSATAMHRNASRFLKLLDNPNNKVALRTALTAAKLMSGEDSLEGEQLTESVAPTDNALNSKSNINGDLLDALPTVKSPPHLTTLTDLPYKPPHQPPHRRGVREGVDDEEEGGSTRLSLDRQRVDATFLQQAVQLLMGAAERGCAEAKTDLGLLLEEAGEEEEAAKW